MAGWQDENVGTGTMLENSVPESVEPDGVTEFERGGQFP
jgi:hypothetical protein